MFSAANEMVHVVLGTEWIDAISPLKILVIAVPLQFLMSIQGVFLDGTGKLTNKTKIRSVGIIIKIALLVIGSFWGVVYFFWAIVVSQILQQLIYSVFVCKDVELKLYKFWSLYLVFFVNSCFVAGAVSAVTYLGNILTLPTIIVLLFQILTGGVILLSVLTMVHNNSLFGVDKSTLQAVPVIGPIWRKCSDGN
jgi:O-antigen/teichoic acid export membrane protein